MSQEVISLSAHQALVTSYQAQIAHLWEVIRDLQRGIFRSKSEKYPVSSDERQLPLFPLPPSEAPPASKEDEGIPVAPHTRHRRGRQPLPAELPRERVEYEPEQGTCSCCGKELEKIGEEITEELEYRPAKLVVKEHVRIKRACRCGKSGVNTGELPREVAPIERCRASIGLIAYIIIAKYCDGLPLHRLESIFARAGYHIPRQRLCDWVAHGVFFLEAIVTALWEELKQERYLLADETYLKVQDSAKQGSCHQGYLWGMLGPPGMVFHYAATRASEVPKELLGGVTTELYLQTDAYAGYNPVYVPGNITRIGCFAHVRRKFLEHQRVVPTEVNQVMRLIAGLYKIEKDARKLSVQERFELRERHSKKKLDELEQLLRKLQQSLLPKHPLQAAILYTLNQWEELCRYTEDGAFKIDNNDIERQMRPVAIGRRNWLFAGSHEGARRAAILFSLINSCKLLGIAPHEYIQDVLLQRARGVKAVKLTPAKWKTARG